MESSLFFEGKKIIVCCGSGGVGKTTIAAAIALKAAQQGKKVIVLTIDPAKRLATAMGLDLLDNEPKKIPLEGSGELFAMMLDTKRTFDRLIEKYTTNPKTKKKILENRLYLQMSNMIAGSQEYMAMERLYELYHKGIYDLLVLDTPPTRHALDFLDAPQKMVNITENSLLKWFLKPGIFAGRVSLGILGKGAEKILSVFDRLAGFSFLHELAEMVALLSDLLGGFNERAKAVYGLLRENCVGFFLITSPTSISIQDALYFHERIKEYKLPFLGFIINRLHEIGTSVEEKDLNALSPVLRKKILSHLHNYDQLALRDQRGVTLLNKMGGKKGLYVTIPLMTTDIHDLEGLERINQELFV